MVVGLLLHNREVKSLNPLGPTSLICPGAYRLEGLHVPLEIVRCLRDPNLQIIHIKLICEVYAREIGIYYNLSNMR